VIINLAAIAFGLLALLAQDSPTPDALPPTTIPWERLRAAYDYNSRILTLFKVVKDTASEDVIREKITFDDPFGLKVTGIFMRPKKEGVYPCAMLFHGAGGRKEDMSDEFGTALATRGIASLSLDAALHGERQGQAQPKGEPRGKLGAVTRVTIVDYRIAIDYLGTRQDVNTHRIGALGYSMGSQLAAILAAVDTRIAATLLYVGGDPIRITFLPQTPPNHKEEIEMVSPSNYVGHISPRPLFMVNGKSDKNITGPMTKLLYESAKDPKQIEWFEAGHGLNSQAMSRGLDWLTDKLIPRK
jgi:fermentation-respiration switch protein FrsA (DUF1100 family)